MVKLALCSVVLMALGSQLALAQVPSAETSGNNLKTCHTEDYIRCALVIAGCTASCGSDYNCLVDCIRSPQNEGIENAKVGSGPCGTINYCPNRCCSTYYPSTGKWSYRCC